MNERIKELAEQAKEYADTKYSKLVSTSRWGDSVPGIRELYTEKLAELIVRECARLAIEKQTENDVSGIVSKNPAKDFAYALVEHFGVE
jgi:hypothetical protein